MKQFLKKYGGLVYITVLSLIVIVVLACSNELPTVLKSMANLDARWMWGAAGCIALYLIFRASTLAYYLHSEGAKISPLNAFNVTLIGQFYSAITPSSSGGQPLQVVTMHQMGIPVSIGTATVSVKFIGFQLAFMLIGGALWIAHPEMVSEQLGAVRWLVVLGYLINLALMVGVALTMRKSLFVENALNWSIRVGVKLHLIKDADQTSANARASLEDYRAALKRLAEKPRDAIVVFLLSCLQIMSYMSVIVCLYHAFGLGGFSNSDLVTLQLLLFITAAFVPLPGAAGAQEGGFYLFFRGVFPDQHILAAMLCWRFFSYYLLLLTGLLGVIAAALRRSIERRRDKA